MMHDDTPSTSQLTKTILQPSGAARGSWAMADMAGLENGIGQGTKKKTCAVSKHSVSPSFWPKQQSKASIGRETYLGTLNHGWSCCSFLDLRPTEVCKVEPLAVTTQSCRKAWFSHAPQPRVCFGHAFELLGIIGSLVVLHGIVALKGHSKKSNSSSPSTHVGGLWHALMQKCAKSIVYEVWSWKVATNYPDPLWRLLQTRQIYTQLNWFITLYFSVTPSFLGNIEPLWTIYTHQSWFVSQTKLGHKWSTTRHRPQFNIHTHVRWQDSLDPGPPQAHVFTWHHVTQWPPSNFHPLGSLNRHFWCLDPRIPHFYRRISEWLNHGTMCDASTSNIKG